MMTFTYDRARAHLNIHTADCKSHHIFCACHSTANHMTFYCHAFSTHQTLVTLTKSNRDLVQTEPRKNKQITHEIPTTSYFCFVFIVMIVLRFLFCCFFFVEFRFHFSLKLWLFIAIRLCVEFIWVRRHYDENYVKAKNAISMECALGIFLHTKLAQCDSFP